jgi:hypothetical protein
VLGKVVTVEQKIEEIRPDMLCQVLSELVMIVVGRTIMNVSISDPHEAIQLCPG